MKSFYYLHGAMLSLLVAVSFTVSGQKLDEADDQAIRMIMAHQIKAWNAGDMKGYMKAYWHSDKLRFVGEGGVREGYGTVLNGYQQRYPDTDAMGKLKFVIISLEPIGDGVALMVGSWELNRKKKPMKGYFTLIWKKIEGNWVIIHDHTT